MRALEKQFVEPHPWWGEYIRSEDERQRRAAFRKELKRSAERRAQLREEAIERIGFTGGLDG